MVMEPDTHMQGKYRALQNGHRPHSALVRYVIIHDFRLFRAVFLGIRVHARTTEGFRRACLSFRLFRRAAVPCRDLVLSHQHPLVGVYHFLGRTFPKEVSLIQQKYPVTVFADNAQIMADKHDGLSHLLEFLELMVALCLKEHIPHGKRLVHNQDFRLNIDGDRKSQPHEHTAGIGLHRLVHIIPDIGKFQDFRQLGIDFPVRKAHHGTVEVHIFDAVIFHVKTGAQLQKRRNPPRHMGLPCGGIKHPGDDFQYGGLA